MTATPLQRAWLEVRAAIEVAQRDLDEETFEVLLTLLTIFTARLNAERLEHAQRTAA